MIDKEVYTLLVDDDINERWDEYRQLLFSKGGMIQLPSLKEFIIDILQAPIGDTTPKEAVLGVIDSWIFSSSHSMEEMIEIANNSSRERMKELKEELDSDTYKVVEKAYKNMMSLPPLDFSVSLQDRIEAIEVREGIERLSIEELRGLVASLSDQCRIKQNLINSLINGRYTAD
jgi:hypothetical protein